LPIEHHCDGFEALIRAAVAPLGSRSEKVAAVEDGELLQIEIALQPNSIFVTALSIELENVGPRGFRALRDAGQEPDGIGSDSEVLEEPIVNGRIGHFFRVEGGHAAIATDAR
jgi:hypothetical protein